jgi:hypothetical protein
MVQVDISPELQERGYKTEKQTSDLLGVAPSTLKAWRVSGKGPRYFKIGRWIFYRQDDLDTWIEGQARVSTTQVMRRAEGPQLTTSAAKWGTPPGYASPDQGDAAS